VRLFIFLFIFFFCYHTVAESQPAISDLEVSCHYSQNSDIVDTLNIVFTLDDVNKIDMIYLDFSNHFPPFESTFHLFELGDREKRDENKVFYQQLDKNTHKILIRLPIAELRYSYVNFVRIYISNTNRNYSNVLLFEKT